MKIAVQTFIKASKETVWELVTDIENSTNTISAIEDIEIISKPTAGLEGLKWKETRIMFGKSATEIMWITKAETNKYYQTRAESHGAVYTTIISVFTKAGGTLLSMDFESKSNSIGSRIMLGVLGFIFIPSMKKALKKDLNDIKNKVEKE